LQLSHPEEFLWHILTASTLETARLSTSPGVVGEVMKMVEPKLMAASDGASPITPPDTNNTSSILLYDRSPLLT
jgi:hypothetical protein